MKKKLLALFLAAGWSGARCGRALKVRRELRHKQRRRE